MYIINRVLFFFFNVRSVKAQFIFTLDPFFFKGCRSGMSKRENSHGKRFFCICKWRLERHFICCELSQMLAKAHSGIYVLLLLRLQTMIWDHFTPFRWMFGLFTGIFKAVRRLRRIGKKRSSTSFSVSLSDL